MNKKYIILGTMALGGLLVASNAFAQSTSVGVDVSASTTVDQSGGTTPPPPLPPRPLFKPGAELREARQDVRDTRMEGKVEIRDLRATKLGEIKDMRAENKIEIDAMRAENKDGTKEEREAGREAIKNAIKANHEEIKNKRDELKKSLQEKREELKNELHQKMQVRFDALIDRLTKIADRIQARINELKVAGTDVTKAQADLDLAVAAIKDASIQASAVVIVKGDDQATKDANKVAIDKVKEAAKVAKDKLMIASYDLAVQKKI